MSITSDDIIRSFVGAVIGLLVAIPFTYLIVDKVVEKREKKKLAVVERTGIQRLRTKLGPYFLTNYLVTLVVEITRAVDEQKVIPKDVATSYSEKLKELGVEESHIKALEDWLVQFKTKHPTGPHTRQPIEVSGGHEIY